MSFYSYLLRPYDFTHERNFFRILGLELKKEYGNDNANHYLIGNVSCNGHMIDAIFMDEQKLIIIDFKDYGGNLVFSENNPWKIMSNGSMSFVAGGNAIRNPYQQVNAYRRSMISLLGSKNDELLDDLSICNWGHIHCMILFQQNIKLDETEIPNIIKRYFSIADRTDYKSKIKDITSNEIRFSDFTLKQILSEFNVQDDNVFDCAEELFEEVNRKVSSTNIASIDKYLSKESPKTKTERLFSYYKTIINVEREKNSDFSSGERYKYILQEDYHDNIIVNLERIPNFKATFQNNISSQYPKNIYCMFKITFRELTIPILDAILPYKDYIYQDEIEINQSEFVLFTNKLEELHYPEDLIQELSYEISNVDLLTEKIKVLKEYIDPNISISEYIEIGLCEANSYTAQLSSEIKIISENLSRYEKGLLKNYINMSIDDNNLNQILGNIIQISTLNDSQRKAVESAFNNKLTVITGPPGTGKTQVVLNIIANAIVANKKILVTSKNNQAVENVRDRFSDVLKENDFLLRFGSKSDIRDKTIPTLEKTIRRINSKSIIVSESSLKLKNVTINEQYFKFKVLKENLNKKQDLTDNLSKLDIELLLNESEMREYKNFVLKKFPILIDSIEDNVEVTELTKNISRWIELSENVITRSKNNINIFTKIFNKKGIIESIKSDYKGVIDLISEIYAELCIGIDEVNDYAECLTKIKENLNLLSEIISNLNQLTALYNLNNQYEKSRDDVANQLIDFNRIEDHLIQESKMIEENLVNLGRDYLDYYIQCKLASSDCSTINKYLKYLPDKIPWKKEELNDYFNSASNFIKIFNASTVTTLSIKNAFPLQDEIFDILVIDEASQCDFVSAIPLIYRAKSVVIIGDPLQLKHITRIQDFEEEYLKRKLELDDILSESYSKKSLYDYCFDISINSKIDTVFLDEHYRCHPEIIKYSNEVFYGPIMGQELKVLTEDKKYNYKECGIVWHNVNGIFSHETKTNQAEIDYAILLAIKLLDENPDCTVGITTPFSKQAKELRNNIPSKYLNRLKADTVHSFQGDEKDIIIFSLAIDNQTSIRTINWLNQKVPYLINVAVTRAKSSLYIVGNYKFIRSFEKDTPLFKLTEYAQINKM